VTVNVADADGDGGGVGPVDVAAAVTVCDPGWAPAGTCAFSVALHCGSRTGCGAPSDAPSQVNVTVVVPAKKSHVCGLGSSVNVAVNGDDALPELGFSANDDAARMETENARTAAMTTAPISAARRHAPPARTVCYYHPSGSDHVYQRR
jgi:hypothetical protein